MRLLTSASIGVLSLLLGIPAVSAQDDAKPRQEEPKPEPRQEEAKPQQRSADQDKQEMKQDQNKLNEKQSKGEKQQQKDDAKAAKESAKQGQMNQAQGNHAQPANGKSGHIPDKDFKTHFGRQHTVVINQPVIVEGQPRFQYSGYWFVISDPWPVGWAYTDSCYIDYIDGEYFLFDLLHPGVQVALFIVVS